MTKSDDSPQPLTERDALARAQRRQALACLRAAQALDGLAPFAVTHAHQYGQSTYLLWAKGTPTLEQCAAVLDSEFEPERGESLSIEENLLLEELTGLSENTDHPEPAEEERGGPHA